VNVERLKNDSHSIYSLYRRLIRLRREYPVLVSGKLEATETEGNVLRFARTGDGTRVLVAMNMASEAAEIRIPDAIVIACTGMDREGEVVGGLVQLNGGEGLVMRVEARRSA
jgi:glycosidase